MSEWVKVRGNNVIARIRKGKNEGIIMTADEAFASSGFYILMSPPTKFGDRWLFHCRCGTEGISEFVENDELVEVWFNNTRIRANPSKGWVHLLRR